MTRGADRARRSPTTVDTAARALYVHFECLPATPPHPALLGVLAGDTDDKVEQIIVDERLAPARVAKARCRAATAAAAVAALVQRAEAEHRTIVGWSLFDRDRLVEACPALERRIKARYSNALQVARRWRRRVHSDVAVERLDNHARLAGYPDAARLRHAAPARWIRHTLAQLKSSNGRYRGTTPQSRRDWHTLLDHNRHGCLALRWIVVRASRELGAWRAYQRTRYCARDGRRRVCFAAGSRSASLERLLRRHEAVCWAFVTAWNPGSIVRSPEANATSQADLKRVVEYRGLTWLSGEGIGEDPAWQPEESLLILGMAADDAVAVGRTFGQLAIVVGRRGGPARLVPCGASPASATRRARAAAR